jgi:hydrogenase maturation protease
MAARGILVGLGNPLMSDDAVGLAIARAVHERVSGFDLEFSTSGGLDVVDRIVDREFAVIIDSMVTGEHSPGTAVRLSFGDGMPTLRASGTHGVGLSEAIDLARASGAAVPSRIVVYGIEVADPHSLGDSVSAAISSKIGTIADEIARDLGTLGRPGEVGAGG